MQPTSTENFVDTDANALLEEYEGFGDLCAYLNLEIE